MSESSLFDAYVIDKKPEHDVAILADGWDGRKAVVAKGIVASAEKNDVWINADASWGNSGGPVATGSYGAAGLVCGGAGDVHVELKDLRTLNAQLQAELREWNNAFLHATAGAHGRMTIAEGKQFMEIHLQRTLARREGAAYRDGGLALPHGIHAHRDCVPDPRVAAMNSAKRIVAVIGRRGPRPGRSGLDPVRDSPEDPGEPLLHPRRPSPPAPTVASPRRRADLEDIALRPPRA